MDKYLVSLKVCTRVEPEECHRKVIACSEGRVRLWLLGTKGSRRTLCGHTDANRYRPDEFAVAARAGLLYWEPVDTLDDWAFADAVDAQGMPKDLKPYEHAFALRSKEGPREEQGTMPLKA